MIDVLKRFVHSVHRSNTHLSERGVGAGSFKKFVTKENDQICLPLHFSEEAGDGNAMAFLEIAFLRTCKHGRLSSIRRAISR